MKHPSLRLALVVTLFLLCEWPGACVAQAGVAHAVVAWGENYGGQTTLPFAAQSGVTAIAAGGSHTVALKSDGSVVAWGKNDFGQTTVPLAAQSGVTAIAAGGSHTVALKSDGSVVAWGKNDFGQTTVPLAAQSGVAAIAAGGFHTVVLKRDGSLMAWGKNDYGQRTIPLAAQSGVTAIAAGGWHTVALKNDGSVVAWGNNQARQRTVPLSAQSGVVAIAAGETHTVALKNDGTMVAWGANWAGQVTGAPPTEDPSSAIASPVTQRGQVLSGVRGIAAGGSHTVALKNDGTVVAWGNNDYGQTTIPLSAQGGVHAIAAGSSHTVALVIPAAPQFSLQPVGQAVNAWQSAGFSVVATGYPLNYQWRKDGVDLAGATSATYRLPFAQPDRAGNYTVVVSNSAGSVTSAPPAVLTVNPIAAPGTVVAWGYYGEFGYDGSGQPQVPVAAQSGVVAVAISASAEGYGDAHTVALKEDGSVVTWGSNCCGQTTVPIAARREVTAIAAGGAHSVALKSDGTVVAWGLNNYGQVTGTPKTDGDSYPATASPVVLGGQVLTGVTAIAAGMWHTAALKNDGSVVAWGNNDQGQLTGTPATGRDPNITGASPVVLGGQVLSGVTAIAAGLWHTVALKSDGTVVAWGNNRIGQVTGTPTTDEPSSEIAAPVTLGGKVLSRVTAVAAGGGQTLALREDGTVTAWGQNVYGQVTGTPATDELPSAIASPVTLGGEVLSGVTAIAASSIAIAAELGDFGSHSVALKNDGTVVAWGYNHAGQVTGTATTFSPSSAVSNPVTLEGQVLRGVTAISASHFQTVALIGGVRLLPPLRARSNGNELILSWPTNAPGFALQSTLDLTVPVAWLDSPGVPAVVGAHFTITNTPSGATRFYRLRKF